MEIVNEFYETTSWHDTFNQAAFKFYISYSRFEYALKRAGYVFTRNGTIAQASIANFITEIKDQVDFNDDSIRVHVSYIFDNPPQELHFIDGRLHWIPIAPQSRTLDFLIRCMRTTRNNLFHGNKQIPGNSLDRNLRLTYAFLPVINKMLEHNESVRNHYLETLEE